MATPTKPQLNPHAIIGVIVCMLGVLFTLDNLHLIDANHLLQYWPLAPIGVGLLILMQAQQPVEWVKGAIWMAVGGLFLARSLGYLPFNPWAVWPLFLVMLGIRMMWHPHPNDRDGWRDWRMRRRERQLRRKQQWAERMGFDPNDWAHFGGHDPRTASTPRGDGGDWTKPPYSSFAPGGAAEPAVEPPPIPDTDPNASGSFTQPDPDTTSSRPGDFGRGRPRWPNATSVNGRVTLFALMSGVTRKFKGIFRGGQLTAIMGGLELDLRGAEMQDVAVIDTFAFWGGIEIYVPEDWSVVNEGFAFMGGFDDQTHSQPPDTRPHLVVRGLALMGGVEIKVKKKDNWWKGK